MYDSLPIATLAICALAAIAGVVFGRKTTDRKRAIFSASLAAVTIATLWWWVPHFLQSGENTDPQGGWGLVAVASWSMFAIPVAVIATLATHRRPAHKSDAA